MSKNILTLIRTTFSLMKRYASMQNIKAKLDQMDSNIVSKEDGSVDLVRQFILKRSKSRFEKLGTLRCLLRIIMLVMRLNASKIMDPVFFAEVGFLENLIGIFMIFSFKNSLIKINKYSKARQEALIAEQKRQISKKRQLIGAGTGDESWHPLGKVQKAKKEIYARRQADYVLPSLIEEESQLYSEKSFNESNSSGLVSLHPIEYRSA